MNYNKIYLGIIAHRGHSTNLKYLNIIYENTYQGKLVNLDFMISLDDVHLREKVPADIEILYTYLPAYKVVMV